MKTSLEKMWVMWPTNTNCTRFSKLHYVVYDGPEQSHAKCGVTIPMEPHRIECEPYPNSDQATAALGNCGTCLKKMRRDGWQ